MPIMKPIITACLLLILAISCAKTEDAKKPDVCEDARTKDKEIQSLVSDKSCIHNSECKSIAYGYKACGSFSSYLIYSTKTVDSSALASKVADYNVSAEACVKSQKTVSDCSVPIEPALSCLLSLCTN